MNKKILGLFLTLGTLTVSIQSAAINDELNALFRARAARQEAGNRDDNPAPENVVIAPAQRDPEHVNPAPIVQEVENNAEEENIAPPIQAGFFARMFGGILRRPLVRVVGNPITTEALFTCNICQRNISAEAKGNQKLEQTSCKHNFHLECLTEHKEMVGNTCPECQANLNDGPAGTVNDEETYTEAQIYKCVICLEPLLETDDGEHKVFATPCQHFFHKDCLGRACQAAADNWGRQACPTCRQSLNTVAAPIQRVPHNHRAAVDMLAMAQEHEEDLLRAQQDTERAQRERDNALANQVGRQNLTTTTALALAGTGATLTAFIPGAPHAIKSGLTTAGTTTYKTACQYPRETAGAIVIAGTGYALVREIGINTIGSSVLNRNKEIMSILLLGTLGAGIAYNR